MSSNTDSHEKRHYSPSAVVKIEGGSLAIALSLITLGGLLVGAILVTSLIESKAKEASAVAVVRAGNAERDVALARHDFQTVVGELKKHGIDVPVN